MSNLTRTVLAAVTVFAAMMSMGHADDYPSRRITIVVPFAAGSGSDTIARIIGQHLTEKLGQSVVVENKSGATGAIAAVAVARAAPDGYTLLLGTNSTHGSNSALYKALAYDPIKDFAPVAHTADFAYFLVVNPELPIKSPADLIAYGTANPGKLSYAGGSSTSIVMAETFAKGAATPLYQISYKSNPQGLNDVIAGRVSLMFADVSSSRGFVDSGTLRAIAVTSGRRSALVPNLPTIDETAVTGFDLGSFTGLFAPAGTPRAVLDKLNAEVNAMLARPEIVKQLAGLGCEPRAMSVDDFTNYIGSEVEKWVRLVKQAGIEAQ